ncbi:MAG: DUF1906 domain-containing protein [Gemmatimonadetes bacterium]|nr:DUF1906 domain-containing protein [Gemmatimonadota bacterium]
MALSGSVQSGSSGLKGFDANTPVSATTAQEFHAQGYRFCVRYVGREVMKSNDLTAEEAQTILASGLALMPVQHVLDPGWNPTAALGQEYGANAAKFAAQIGFAPGTNLWCDLECVATDTTAQDVIGYCNAWYDQVAAGGFVPGLYVGYQPGLTGQQLYASLKFQHYWGAYNVDVSIPNRGWQIKQSTGTCTIGGITTECYDDNVTMTDLRGGQVLWMAGA